MTSSTLRKPVSTGTSSSCCSGMMIIVGILRRTGVFEYVAIWAAKRAKGSPLRVMVLLVLITAIASAFLDNVTTVLLIAPVTLLVCDRLDVSPVPFLISRGVGVQHRWRRHADRGSAEHHHRQPVRAVVQRLPSQHGTCRRRLALAAFIAMLPVLFRGSFTVDPERVADVMALNEREAITDRRLLVNCGVVLAARVRWVHRPRRLRTSNRPWWLCSARGCWCC